MNYNTNNTKRARIILAILLLAVVAAGIGYIVGTWICQAVAEDATVEAWVLCRKTETQSDYVNLRSKPRKNVNNVVGRLDCGDRVELDGETENGFARVVNLTIDSPSDVWIYTGYLVFDEPRKVNDVMVVIGNGRVAARKCCGGEIIGWVKPDTEIYVYWKTEEWCVTSRGFIRTEYLDVGSV